jgi:hypothetical protein
MPPTSPPTRSGPRRLSEVARHLVVPTDITSTGWPAVRKTCVEKLGITFDDWQDGAGRVILAKRADGNLAAMIDGVGMSLPRQVGKTYLIGATVFALCVNMPGLLVIWSAHHARTHGETFLAMQAFAERAKVKPHVRQVFTGSGDEEIRFHNGSRILFGARERGFGRGIPGVDILIFDEAQILSDRALSNMLATLNTSRFGLQLYIGTPPKPEDMSEAFTRMRKEALDRTLPDGAWIEFGADPDAKADDRSQWRRANPSYPKRTPAQSLLRLKRKLTDADWRREGLGIWTEVEAGAQIMPTWHTLATEGPAPAPVSLGIAADVDQTWLSLGAASGGARPHLGSVLRVRVAEAPRFVAEVARIQSERNIPVLIDKKGPASFLIPDLETVGVALTQVGLDEFIQASVDLVNAVEAADVEHGNYDDLNKAVAAAGWRPVGDRRAFARKKGDISALEAVTLAHWGTTNHSEVEPWAMHV